MLYTEQIDCPEFLQGCTKTQTPSSIPLPLAAYNGGDAVRT